MDDKPELPPEAPAAPPTDDTPSPLSPLIASIAAAIAPGAASDARAAGAAACRALLAALDATPGQPLIATPATSPPPIAGLLASLAAMPRDQLIDTVIGWLRKIAPPGARPSSTGAPRFHLIQLPPVGRG